MKLPDPVDCHPDIASPVLVELVRGDMTESRHRGSAVVSNANGEIVKAWGDTNRLIYPRSAIKPLQALAVMVSGAADRYDVDDAELAIACGSHLGESRHVSTVLAWLRRLGLTPDDLECGAHVPSSAAAAETLFRAGGAISQLHNNCSGKHTGFLTLALHLGQGLRGYIDADHPVQRQVREVLQDLYDYDLSACACGIDGCGIPVIGVPLEIVAKGMARFADPYALSPAMASGVRRLSRAMGEQPYMVGGAGNFASEVMAAAKGSVFLKNGAEGVYCAAIPGRGVGVAIKIDDGSDRAAVVAMGAILADLGVLTSEQWARIAPLAVPIVKNVAGHDVGRLRPLAP